MQIKEHMQAIFPAPVYASVQIPVSALFFVSILVFENDIINGNPDVIKAQKGYSPEIIFHNIFFKMSGIICLKLGKPSAEVYSVIISFKYPHNLILSFIGTRFSIIQHYPATLLPCQRGFIIVELRVFSKYNKRRKS